MTATLILVVLPHGRTPSGRLRAGIHVSPRLSGHPLLSGFPDWLHWTDQVRRHGLGFTLSANGHSRRVDVDPTTLRPDVWDAVFRHDSRVDAFPTPDYDQRLVVSYPTRLAHDYLRWAYRTMATRPVIGARGGLAELLTDLVFRDEAGESTLDRTLAESRVRLWGQQHDEPGRGTTTGTFEGPALLEVSSPLAKPAGARDMAEQLALYHHLPPAPGRPPLPHTADELSRLIDFHRALTALSAYPTLLPALGLVFEVELPAAFCPRSPSAGSYRSVQVTAVHPGWTWAESPDLVTPATSYVAFADSFAAAPATTPADFAGRAIQPADIVQGFLALTPENFHVVGVDLDGAMLKAMALADSLAASGSTGRDDDLLPAMRSGGLSLLADSRGQQLLQAIHDNQAIAAAAESGGSMRPLTARDLTRGYRLDVFDDRRGAWRSLHRRDGTYRFGTSGLTVQTEDEEGFVQLAVTQPADDPARAEDAVATAAGIPQPGTDLYVNERVARWNGWSLSAPRPGQPLNRSADPAQSLDTDGTANISVTTFHVQTSFAAHAGSLPALRFGGRYRLRARAVDLSGHSVALGEHAPEHLVAPPDGQLLPHFRFEPVNPPTVVLRTLPGPGGSLLELVIRSRNLGPALDAAPTFEEDERHLAPPRAAVLLAEQHGMLDDASGRLRGDAATYAMLTARDNGRIPTVGQDPIEPGQQLEVSYLPDPLARGVALTDLPQTPTDSAGAFNAGALIYEVIPGDDPRPGSTTHLPFGPDWPDRLAMRIRLVEGTAAPQWDDADRVLTVSLPKARRVTTAASCYLNPSDLDVLGVWDWLRELFEEAGDTALAHPLAGEALVDLAEARGRITRATLEGRNELITPSLPMVLTHAVQQPLGLPTFSRLPIVHDPSSPFAGVTLANDFTPVSAWRSRGSHHAVLLGALQVHAASTGSIDLEARWIDWVDDVDLPAPVTRQGANHVERINLPDTVLAESVSELPADGTGARLVAVYLPTADCLWFAAPADSLDGVPSPFALAAPVHQFGDTLHRTVRYRAVAASRFQEYFPEPGTVTSRTGPALTVDVPSSARPLPPDIAYVVPTFGWVREVTTNTKTEVRRGNGLRVYLHRPWYSSGSGELLGILTWPHTSPPPDDSQREAAKAVITQWGLDPVWATRTVEAIPDITVFSAATHTRSALTLDKTGQLVDVAGHLPAYDEQRRLWYCDIELDNPDAYAPFVRLALARYQPRSIPGVELSDVVLADFAQLTPDRSAALTVDPANPLAARLVVAGSAPSGPTRSLVTVTVEEHDAQIGGDLGWVLAPPATVQVHEDVPAPDDPDSVLYAGRVEFAHRPAPRRFRVVIREFELLPIDPPDVALIDTPHLGSRLIFASILVLDYPLSLFPTA